MSTPADHTPAAYAPAEITTLLFGAGNFQRAFAAWMLARLHARDDVAAGRAVVVRPTDGGRYTDLEAQSWRYHLWTRGLHDGRTVDAAEPVDVIAGAVYPYEDFAAYLALARLPRLHTIVSNTTEAGIRFAPEPWPEDEAPAREFPGKLTQLLHARWRYAGSGAAEAAVTLPHLTLLPCELIADNGQRLREAVGAYARRWSLGAAFEIWLDSACTFCDTLVDRIVPGAPPAGDYPPGAAFGDDRAVVTAEPYHLLAVRGATAGFRASWPLARAGVNVVWADDLGPARALKVGLLNAAHTALVPVGLTHGIATVRAFVDDARWGPWLRALLYEELVPAVAGVPRAAAEAYAKTTLERFANPFVEHRLESILLNGLSKWPARVGAAVRYYTGRGEALPPRLQEAWAAQVALCVARGPAGMPDDAALVRRVVAGRPGLGVWCGGDEA